MTEVPTVQELDAQALEILKTDPQHEIAIKQTEALISLAEGVNGIANFLQQGGLQNVVAAHTKGAIIAEIFGGLASKDGRNSLDARTIKQNSLEIVEIIETVFNKMQERIREKAEGVERSKDMVDPEAGVREYYDAEGKLVAVKMDGEKS